MSAISEFSERVEAKFTEIGASVDAAVASVGGVTADVTSLKEIIRQLQENPGPITPADQALLDRAEGIVNGLATKTTGVADALKALDDSTAATETPTPA